MKPKDNNIITLHNEEWSCEIDVENGARCVNLRCAKYKAVILREPQEEKVNSVAFGMPILFPANRIKDGRFSFEGREYIFPINEERTGCHLHGELHKTPFEIIDKKDNSLVCRYAATKDRPYLSFPHEFSIIIEYSLSRAGLTHSVIIENNSKKNMPFSLGFHTNFNALFLDNSLPEDIFISANITEEFERDEKRHLPTGVKPPPDKITTALLYGSFNPFSEKISRHYRAEGKLTITDSKKRVRVVYDPDKKFGFLMIYNEAGGSFISLEPMSSLAGCQNSPFPREEVGFDFLKPGETREYISNIYIEAF